MVTRLLSGGIMRALGLAILCSLVGSAALASEAPPLLKEVEAAALSSEISGAAAKRTVQGLSLHHRMRGSEGYRIAGEVIRDSLKSFGLSEVEIISLPADGGTFYGTQRSRPAWNASFAELWERAQHDGGWVDAERVASWAEQPISLAQDSVSGRVEAELVDVGAGTSENDYRGKEVRGKLVLISSQPEQAAPFAIARYGAAGIVSWAQNQKQAWWGEDEHLVRWGHLDAWENPTFAFMVSPARARAWQEKLARGEIVRLRAEVEAGRSRGSYLIPTAVIPGRDRTKEIVFSCHLDHPSPGANDNASGCAGILEAARGLSRLVAQKKLPQPERTLRFIWPCEIECSIALLNARPEFARRTLATIHLDMIGGDTEKTKSILRVQGSPPSQPSFVSDVGFAIARWVNAQSLAFAETGTATWPLLDPEGDKRALQALVGGFSEGSDNVVWTEGSWRIPIIYISDWPDRYIHTQRDIPENLDPTKMKRAIFIAAAAGWYLANVDQSDVPAMALAVEAERLDRRAGALRRAASMADADVAILLDHLDRTESAESRSFGRFDLAWTGPTRPTAAPVTASADGSIIYRRKAKPKGPMNGFGFSWIGDQLKRTGLPRPALLDRPNRRDRASFGFEALNLIDGQRTVQQIRDDLLATVGAAPVEEVADYLGTLERLDLLERAEP